MRRLFLILGLILSLSLALGFTLALAKDVPRMTVEELKGLLDNPEVVIIDVRTDRDWDNSTQKIKGAGREDPQKIETWAKKYPPGKTIVLYCA
jgi:rhodanese-related sulfurtransferase